MNINIHSFTHTFSCMFFMFVFSKQNLRDKADVLCYSMNSKEIHTSKGIKGVICPLPSSLGTFPGCWDASHSLQESVTSSGGSWGCAIADLLHFESCIFPKQMPECCLWYLTPAAGYSKYNQVPFYLKFIAKNNQVVERQKNNTQFKFRCQVAHLCLRTGDFAFSFWHKRPVLLGVMNYRQPFNNTHQNWH
jgi:hypothetical protein